MFTYRDVLDSDGLIAQRRPGYERRAAQLAMAAEVDAAIRNKKCLAVEALSLIHISEPTRPY